MAEGPEARGVNRPFSGPPCTEGSSGDAAVLKALLALKKSSPDDFNTLMESAMSASEVEPDVEPDDAELQSTSMATETSVSETDMSSDGGSTVRELNKRLLEDSDDGEGNGTVSGDAGKYDAWQTQRSSKGKGKRRRPNSGSESESVSNHTDRIKRIDTSLHVYIKGAGFDIAKEASKQPIQFSRRLSQIVGAVGEVKLSQDSVRVTCLSPQQKTKLLSVTEWGSKVITVSEPWGRANTLPNQGQRKRSFRGIIFGVSAELSESEIVEETKAFSARCLTVYNSSGNKVRTGNVVLAFPDDIPEFVCIGYLRYKVKPYIPLPTRCAKCQGFGHIAAYCKRQVRCVRCGKGHPVEECPVKDDLAQAVCVNCKGQHSAAYKGCSMYQQVCKALKVSVTQKVSYRDALVKVKSAGNVLQHPGAEVTIRSPPQTSTPAPATVQPSAPRPVAPARRELFQKPSNQPALPRQQNAAAPDKQRSDESKPSQSFSVRDMMKQITHYLLYSYYFLDGTKPASDVARLRSNLYTLACQVFGQHGGAPCFSAGCCECKD